MVQTVNGYACYNCADAALAKRGINPAAPKQPAGAQGQVAPGLASSQGISAPGSLSTGLQPSSRSAPPQLSAPSGGRGQFVDLVA